MSGGTRHRAGQRPGAVGRARPPGGGRRPVRRPVRHRPPDGLLLSAHVAGPGGIETWRRRCRPAAASYPALTPRLGAAFWYEREIHDLFGVVPEGTRGWQPLILARLARGLALPRHVAGPGCSRSRTARSAPA